MVAARLSKYQLAVFFVLAYAITWSAQLPAYIYAHNNGHTLSNEANVLHLRDLVQGDLDPGLLPYLLVFTFAFGPSLAGIIVTALFKGRAGLADLWTRTTRVRVARRWVLFVLLFPVALALGSLALSYPLGGMQPVDISFLVPPALFLGVLAYMLVFTGLAEEIGWRGYALPELQRTRTAERASWILGIGWGLWHLPSNLLAPYLRGELTPQLAVAVLAGLTVGIVGYTIVLTWVYNNTQSVFWIIVLHAWANTVQSYLVLSSDSFVAQVLYGVLPWAVAAYLLKKYDVQTLTHRHQPASTV